MILISTLQLISATLQFNSHLSFFFMLTLQMTHQTDTATDAPTLSTFLPVYSVCTVFSANEHTSISLYFLFNRNLSCDLLNATTNLQTAFLCLWVSNDSVNFNNSSYLAYSHALLIVCELFYASAHREGFSCH